MTNTTPPVLDPEQQKDPTALQHLHEQVCRRIADIIAFFGHKNGRKEDAATQDKCEFNLK
ncbi:hypothetical protein I2I11_04035 [Pontibacter sp. 172403-2]|uniref:hypothetical protein n=1 Tax=Pontibacter rufus TaxID=2791028 RepID=UPI0018B006A1|nr:hypothetical protein [Pontibacter sp. 172403-2]MBF9252453.1 hypothetical protein [Pontibacter sp. 172403-2]